MRKFAIEAAMLAVACRAVAFHLCGAIMLSTLAFGQVRGQSAAYIGVGLPAPLRPDFLVIPAPNDGASPGTLVDRLGNVLFRPATSFAERPVEEVGSTVSTSFAFVPGHYYASNYLSRVITEYDVTGTVVGSYTVPSALGEDVRGLAFGADDLLYATLSRDLSGFSVLALRSDGTVEASYSRSVYTGANISYGKIAMDNQYLYVCGRNVLSRFLLGEPVTGTTIYTENEIFDVKPLPNGHLFVASRYYVDEITIDGVFVRRLVGVGNSGDSFIDIRGIEYDPKTNILFVSHIGFTGLGFRIIRIDALTGTLLSSADLYYPDDLFLDSSGNLLVGSRFKSPTFFSQNLEQGDSLHGERHMFVTQYVPSTRGQALNISTRLRAGLGDRVMIAGFITNGREPKSIVVRGIGPSLASAGVSGVMDDPVLELRDGDGVLLLRNDDWQDDATQAAQLTALGLAPQNPKESAIVATLHPSASYTAILSGKNGGTGVGLVEIYDTNQSANSHLANISTRGFVEAGENVMIGGFILGGHNGVTVVAVRGLGPSLAQTGLSNVLADPTLELHDGNGALLIANDDWQNDPLQATQLSAHGLAPSDPKESGIWASLPPGTFTAVLAGKNGGSGIGLVEIYDMQ